jgi:hypothetical protein
VGVNSPPALAIAVVNVPILLAGHDEAFARLPVRSEGTFAVTTGTSDQVMPVELSGLSQREIISSGLIVNGSRPN